MVAGWNPVHFQKHRFHILHFPNSTGLFTKPTGRHYTKYRFSPDIVWNVDENAGMLSIGETKVEASIAEDYLSCI